MCGALLVNQDVSHFETNPNIFIPPETYVPVRWEFSDFGDTLVYYLSHEDEAKEITRNVYSLLHEYCVGGGFVEQMKPVFTI